MGGREGKVVTGRRWVPSCREDMVVGMYVWA